MIFKPPPWFWRTDLGLLVLLMLRIRREWAGGAELLPAVVVTSMVHHLEGARSGCLREGHRSADFTSLYYIAVQVWARNQGKKETEFAIMRNANVWELDVFTAADNTGNCFCWWGSSAPSRHWAKSVLRCSKDMTDDLWCFHRELSVTVLYSYKDYEG